MKIKIFYISALVLLVLSGISKSYAQKEGDRILAVVGNDIILESDLQYQLQIYARNNQMTSINPAIAQQIFQQLLTDKIILAKAEQDSIEVKDEEVNKELDYRIKSIVEQVGSEQRIQEIYGMPLVKIRLTMKDDLIKKMKSDKMKRKKFANQIKVTDNDVNEFFYQYRDSLPNASEEFELYHIFRNRLITDAEKKAAKDKALIILDSIKAGINFDDLAKRNSDDKGSAVNGGDLGYAKKGVFVKEFEEALFSMNVGDVSGAVETEYGYHIIKLNEKKGEQYKSQHILVAFKKSESWDFETINFLNKLRDSLTAGQLNFETAAKLYSQDPETSPKGGYAGLVPVEKLDSNYISAVRKLSPGEISNPIRVGDDNNYGYELIKVVKINPPHKLTLEGDFDRIKKMAQVSKENKVYAEWVEELKKSIYVDIKF